MGSGTTKRLVKENLSILDRVTNLENQVKALQDGNVRLMQALQESFSTSDKMLRNLAEILSAAVAVVGPEEVTKAVEDARKTAREEQILKAKTALEGLIADGTMVVTGAVSEASLVVGHETLPDGTDSGRLQFLVNELAEDRKAALMGKTVGFVIDFPSGSKFEINEIYDVALQPSQEGPEPKTDEPVDLRDLVENDLR